MVRLFQERKLLLNLMKYADRFLGSGVEILANALRQNTVLTSLSLFGNCIVSDCPFKPGHNIYFEGKHNLNHKFAADLCNALLVNKTLTSLTYSGFYSGGSFSSVPSVTKLQDPHLSLQIFKWRIIKVWRNIPLENLFQYYSKAIRR
jgi:hypothetical protein